MRTRTGCDPTRSRGCAAAPPGIEARVSGAHGVVRVGCSGWDYADWRGVVYPDGVPRRRWFEEYARRFDTVELNATFYRLPAVGTVDRWAAEAPDGFVYAAKLGAFGSHRMKLRDATTWLPNHVERVRRLGHAMGPTLVQLPPRWHRDAGRLDDFLAVATRTIRWAVEIRDPTWLHDEVYAVLEHHGAALCIHDLIADHPWRLTTDWTYLRFHGPRATEHRYVGRYGGRRLWRPARQLQRWLADGVDVFAYFNNDYHGDAVRDAEWLHDRLTAPA